MNIARRLVVPAAPTIGTATVTSFKTISVTFTPNIDTGGAPVTSYDVYSTDGLLHVTGSSSPITINVPIAYMYTYFEFYVTATNSVGTSPPSSNSNSVKTEPPNGTNLGTDIGYYVGSGVVISGKWSTTGTWGGCNYYLTTNVTHTSNTGPYRWASSTELQGYRTSGGGVYLTVGGPYWTGTGGGGSHIRMTNTGVLSSAADTNAYTMFPVANLA